ncbi:HalOD1 output domain-containing protein [Halosolutus amylolyticus]|uniref:HalOD1 output domain-containing protein n=1 Tax=Halosolutus amylolyticus TaxID=2932267 RepID=A0ABD5PVA6_9EURY|nr:HalOD1 output domain-containing protein [Halosolutus amylolyticus]
MDPTDSTVRDFGAGGETHVCTYEYDAETPASIAVIHAICALTDVDPIDAPTELGFVLYEHVDPNALDTLLADGTGDGDVVVSFEVTNGYTYAVDVADDGRVVVRRDA